MDNKGTQGKRQAAAEGLISVAASLMCIVLGMALGLVVLGIIDVRHALNDGMMVILTGGIASMRSMGAVLVNAAPLIMTGLSVGFAFKAGLFNIGVAGQYTLGAFGALYCAMVLQLPWYLCLLAAMLLGAVWGAIVGLFRACLNVNEVISAIMFNWIGSSLVNDLLYGKSPMDDIATAPQAMIPGFGLSDFFGKLQSVTIAIFIAILFAMIVHVLLSRTTFGYELKACGLNKNAARYAGINEKRTIVLSMLIAGALAGAGAGLYYLSTVAEWNPQISIALPAMGYNGIGAALLACSNPIGTIFSSLFIAYITVGGTKLSAQYYTKEIADVIIALIIYLCAFSMPLRRKIRAALAGRSRRTQAVKGGNDGCSF